MQSTGGLIGSLRVHELMQPFASVIVKKTSTNPVVLGMGMLTVWESTPTWVTEPLLKEYDQDQCAAAEPINIAGWPTCTLPTRLMLQLGKPLTVCLES